MSIPVLERVVPASELAASAPVLMLPARTATSYRDTLNLRLQAALTDREPSLAPEETAILMPGLMQVIEESARKSRLDLNTMEWESPTGTAWLDSMVFFALEHFALKTKMAYLENQLVLLESLTRTSGDPILIFRQLPDGSWPIVVQNNAAATFFGYNKHMSSGVKAHNLIHGYAELVAKLQKHSKKVMTVALKANQFGSGTTKEVTLTGSVVWMETDRGEYVGLLARDVSAEVAKKEAMAKIVHDLKTPLTAIKLSVSLMEAYTNTTDVAEKVSSQSHKVYFQVEKMTSLINGLLDLARLEESLITFSPTTVNISEVLQQQVATFTETATTKGLTLEAVIAPDLSCQGDQAILERAVSNILSNALKYTPQGSVKLEAAAQNGHVVITVTDTGIGIPADDQANIFKEFHRTEAAKNGFEGTGLGLSIVQQIIQAHKGTLSVTSEEHTGSTFTMTLPR